MSAVVIFVTAFAPRVGIRWRSMIEPCARAVAGDQSATALARTSARAGSRSWRRYPRAHRRPLPSRGGRLLRGPLRALEGLADLAILPAHRVAADVDDQLEAVGAALAQVTFHATKNTADAIAVSLPLPPGNEEGPPASGP